MILSLSIVRVDLIVTQYVELETYLYDRNMRISSQELWEDFWNAVTIWAQHGSCNFKMVASPT